MHEWDGGTMWPDTRDESQGMSSEPVRYWR